jgi:mono/diheme cytochrome c family protein
MRASAMRFGLAAVAVLASAAFTAGGWATITVEDLPDSVVASEGFELAFRVRAHGMRVLTDLEPVVEARSGRERVRAQARPGEKHGLYEAALVLPVSGEWSITIHSGYGDSNVTLLPIAATVPGTEEKPDISDAERGRRLFVAKGCLTCHVHEGVKASGGGAVGPVLTDLPHPADYIARALADPTIIPRRTPWEMPDLGLKRTEIAALVAFLKPEGSRGDR